MNPDRLAELEEQRRFLLASIRDLEREHEVGDVDDDDFHALRDGYVARAAAVLHEIEDGRSSLPLRPRTNWARRAAIIGGTLAAAVGLGVFVANSAGQRLPGQSLTGGQAADEVAVQLAEGRRLLGTDSEGSRAAYARVQELEPANAEAATYIAYLAVLDAQQAGDQAAVRQGVAALQEAATLDETYGDPHCLLAVAGGNFLDPPDKDLVAAQGPLCLALDPPQGMVPMIEGLIARMSGATTTTILGNDVDALLAAADAKQSAGDFSGALADYQRVLQLEPDNLVARTRSSYLVALNGRDTGNQEQVLQGIDLLQTTADRNPDFADAHCLLSIAAGYLLEERDVEVATAEGQRCLALDPPADLAPLVQQLLDDIAAG
ncbi:MAG: hypothetical protein WCC60_15180 [Ilumatobacteraceae bacterium]